MTIPHVITFTASAHPYVTIGCFKDQGTRAVEHWLASVASIDSCYRAAKEKGFHVFAVEDRVECRGGYSAAKTFNKYGKSSNCRADGRGGIWANQVYIIKGKGKLANVQPTLS